MQPNYKFSGHETFPCRYAWLPKTYLAIRENPSLFVNDADAMIELGIGRNMTNAAKFWVLASGIAKQDEGGIRSTPFGESLLGDNGFDPFLEDIRTLWLIHWKLSTQFEEPLFAWDFLLNRWQRPEFTRTEILSAFEREAEKMARKLSPVTLAQHFDVFLHTYFPTRGRKGQILEDNLDCPLVEINLIRKTGERPIGLHSSHDPVYAFNREPKPEINGQLFAYCLWEFWKHRRGNEATLSLRDVTVGAGSPGQIFKLPEADVRDRLCTLDVDSGGTFSFRESAAQQQITRREFDEIELLSAVYEKGEF